MGDTVRGTSAERKELMVTPSCQAATYVPVPGEELTTWWAWVTGFERFQSASAWRKVLTYSPLPYLRLTCNLISSVSRQEAVIYSL